MVPRTVEAELSSRNTSDGSEGSIFWIDSYWNGTNLPPSQEFSTFIPHRELKKEESYWKDRNIEKVEEILIKYLYQKVLRIVTRNNVMTHQFILEVRNVPFQSAASNSYEPLANNRIFYAYFHVNISVPQCLEIYLKNNRLYIFHLSEQQSHDIAEEEIDPLKLFVRRHVIFYFH